MDDDAAASPPAPGDDSADDSLSGWHAPGDPDGSDRCAACGGALADHFGWCSGCRMALCFACGRQHYCRPTCAANGCRAGLCVREVRGGILHPDRWGLPPV